MSGFEDTAPVASFNNVEYYIVYQNGLLLDAVAKPGLKRFKVDGKETGPLKAGIKVTKVTALNRNGATDRVTRSTGFYDADALKAGNLISIPEDLARELLFSRMCQTRRLWSSRPIDWVSRSVKFDVTPAARTLMASETSAYDVFSDEKIVHEQTQTSERQAS